MLPIFLLYGQWLVFYAKLATIDDIIPLIGILRYVLLECFHVVEVHSRLPFMVMEAVLICGIELNAQFLSSSLGE